MRNVPQDASSGKDHRAKGAKTIELEDGEARVRDIVTYPGGDRVDWKVVTLPEGQKGQLKIRLRMRPARPGMDVAFNVYDEWFGRIARAKPGDGSKRTKGVKIDDARGTYYIQVYAPRRKDAAEYRLALRFRERKAPDAGADADLLAQLDDPPSLPAVPEPAPEPEPEPDPGAGPGGPGAGPAPGVGGPEPEPEPVVSSIKARVIRVQVASGGGVIVTLNRGKNDGVARGWKGTVLQRSSESPLDGGEFKIIKVTTRASVARIKLTLDQIKANNKVLLTPP